MAREDVREPRSTVMKHEEPEYGLKSGLEQSACGGSSRPASGGKTWAPPFHRGQSLSGMGPSVKGMGWGDSEEAAGKRVSRQERGNGVDSRWDAGL